MVKLILGPSGSGKTKWLVENANKDMMEGNGNIVFVDVDDDHIFTLNYNVRLINASEFNINSSEKFFGFLCGIIGQDYDVEKIYIDGIYNIIPYDRDQAVALTEELNKISDKFKTEFYIGLDVKLEDLPEHLWENAIELEAFVRN